MSAHNVWFEFMGPQELCGLCGNTGEINTIQTVKSPLGTPCGVKAYCICPNGRAIKKHSGRKKWVDSSIKD